MTTSCAINYQFVSSKNNPTAVNSTHAMFIIIIIIIILYDNNILLKSITQNDQNLFTLRV